MTDAPIIIETGQSEPDRCVIWLHGLGADGHDFEPIVPELQLPDTHAVRFIFPHAPMIPVTINGGYIMRAWYDIKAMDIASEQDEAGIRQSQQYLQDLVHQQITGGIDSTRVVLAGFSQGGAIILHTGLRFEKPLAGLMALSTYLPLASTLPHERHQQNARVPIFLAHGDSDPVVAPQLAEHSREQLQRQDYPLQWHEYRGMQHSLCAQEIVDIRSWLIEVLEL